MKDAGSKQRLNTRRIFLARVSFAAMLLCILFFAPSAAYATAPYISSLSPSSGPVGALVTISGTNFGSQGAVRFNGTVATTNSWGNTQIVAVVPTNATTGNVMVAAMGGNSNGVMFTVLITPTLTFTTIPTKTFGVAPFTVSASSASSGAITYSVTSGPATISGSTVTITGAGTVVLHASQAAWGNYTAANASTSFTVNPATPALTFNAIPAQTYGVAPFPVSASSPSQGAITYSVTSGPATIPTGLWQVTITGVGTVVLGASQAATVNFTTATTSISFTVNPATPSLAFTPIPTKIYGVAPFTVSASSASQGLVTYSVTSGPATNSNSTVTITGVGTVVLGASQAANGNYTTATASTSFTVIPAPQTLNSCW